MGGENRIDVKLHVSDQTAAAIERLTAERNIPRNGLVLQALGLLQVVHDAQRAGRFVGITEFRDRLDTVLLGPL